VNGLEQTILQGFSLDGNTENVYKVLDENLQSALLIASESQDKSVLFDGFGDVFRGNVIAIVIMISALLQTVLAGVIIILAKVSLFLIFALSPLMLSGLFFPQTAKFADAWFNQALNYVFVSVIVIFFQSIAIEIFKTQIKGLTSDTTTLVIIGKIALLSIANFFVMKAAPNIAAGLAGGVSSGTASLVGMARTMAGVGKGIGIV
ncbi:type IV secretion system protein, partial [Kingella kingae]|uniref:type IV secretion system protein n=1 Tax=Kingella kingae TaxID=504 RepID=UPI00254C48D6